MGDFNAVDDRGDRLRKAGTTPSTPVDHALVALVGGLELVDVWKALRPRDSGHTYFHQGGSARIDRIYCSRSIRQEFTLITTDTTYVTDHAVLHAACSILPVLPTPRPPRPSIWKLNTKILSEDAFRRQLTTFISHAVALPLKSINVVTWWDSVFKPGVKRIAQSYCRRRASLVKEMGQFYQNCLAEITDPTTELDWPTFQALREEAREWHLRALMGAKIRSRSVTDSDIDSPSLFHVRKEKSNGRSINIVELHTDAEGQLSDLGAINAALTNGFQSVFGQTHAGDPQLGASFLDSVGSRPQIPDLTSPPTLIDLTAVVTRLPSNKSPGEDGIPYDFYKQFWDVIGPVFLEMFTSVLHDGRVSGSQSVGLVRLIPKCESPTKATDYRPITLLNCDYKIMAGVMAARLKKTLPQVIGDAQRGGIPGRNISDNLSLYRDILAFVEERNINLGMGPMITSVPGVVIGIDFAKAYDLVQRDILWDIMEKFGYPPTFVKWIKTLYTDAKMFLLNGQSIAGKVDCLSSLRQGCPLSIHLYVLFLEPLLLRLSTAMNGISFFGRKVAVRAFVDDVAVFTDNDKDIILSDQVIGEFCKWTSSRLNKTKTKALGLGGWSRRTSWPLQWLEAVDKLTLLGIPFSHSVEETTSRTWEKAFGHFQGLLRSNIGRCFTLFHRVTFLKVEAFSRIIYVGQVLPCPPLLIEKINRAALKFLWAGRLERPPPGTIYRSVDEGGLAMIHTEFFLGSLFLRQILSSLLGPDTVDRFLLRYWLAFPTRGLLGLYAVTAAPVAFFHRPRHVEEARRLIVQLAGVGGEVSPLSTHRKIYSTRIRTSFEPGHVELAHPTLDWHTIWKTIPRLPFSVRDSFFLFNHRLLYTRDRANRIDGTINPECDRCKSDIESAEHLMIGCPSRATAINWLKNKLQSLGCSGTWTNWINGDIGQLPLDAPARLLVAVFVDITWRTRQRKRLPSIAEYESKWTQLVQRF
jgi:hypothetical protein